MVRGPEFCLIYFGIQIRLLSSGIWQWTYFQGCIHRDRWLTRMKKHRHFHYGWNEFSMEKCASALGFIDTIEKERLSVCVIFERIKCNANVILQCLSNIIFLNHFYWEGWLNSTLIICMWICEKTHRFMLNIFLFGKIVRWCNPSERQGISFIFCYNVRVWGQWQVLLCVKWCKWFLIDEQKGWKWWGEFNTWQINFRISHFM